MARGSRRNREKRKVPVRLSKKKRGRSVGKKRGREDAALPQPACKKSSIE